MRELNCNVLAGGMLDVKPVYFSVQFELMAVQEHNFHQLAYVELSSSYTCLSRQIIGKTFTSSSGDSLLPGGGARKKNTRNFFHES